MVVPSRQGVQRLAGLILGGVFLGACLEQPSECADRMDDALCVDRLVSSVDGGKGLRDPASTKPAVDSGLEQPADSQEAEEGVGAADAGVPHEQDRPVQDAGLVEDDGGELDPEPLLGVRRCYLDLDGDGVGSGAPVACPISDDGGVVDDAGLSAAVAHVSGDCDDLSTARAPGFIETCDGIDNDCDDEVDEGYDVGASCQGVGVCGAGTIECASLMTARCSTDPGGSADESEPDEVACDGLDEDCDGEVDENWGIGEACDGVGLCGLGVLECASVSSALCSTGAEGSASEAVAEVCDGLDNDCDGVPDDGLTVRTYWADCDGDGVGAGASFRGCRAPTGGSCAFVTKGNDCVDTNANMHPDQTDYFTRSVNGSFDYNCDGKNEKRYTRTSGSCSDAAFCLALGRWTGDKVPNCGSVGDYCDAINGCRELRQPCR